MHNLRRTVRAALVLAAVFTCMTANLTAQEFRATVSGSVADPTGAVVPDASVVVKEAHTGTVNQTKSDSAGQ